MMMALQMVLILMQAMGNYIKFVEKFQQELQIKGTKPRLHRRQFIMSIEEKREMITM